MKNFSKIKLTIVLSASVMVTGCFTPQTYTRSADSISTIGTSDTLKGRWTYSIDDSVREARRSNFKPTSQPCSLHSYNLEAGATLESAIRKAMQEFLADGSETKSADYPDHIIFKLDSFQPRFSCTIGQTEGYCAGTAEIALGVTVAHEGRRRSFTVSSERTADASGGEMCTNALEAPAQASRKAIKDAVERAMERILTVTK